MEVRAVYTLSTESSTGPGAAASGPRSAVGAGGLTGPGPVATGRPHSARPGAWSWAPRARPGTAGSPPSRFPPLPQPGTRSPLSVATATAGTGPGTGDATTAAARTGAVTAVRAAVDCPQNSPRTTASAATRQHHCERGTATGLPGAVPRTEFMGFTGVQLSGMVRAVIAPTPTLPTP